MAEETTQGQTQSAPGDSQEGMADDFFQIVTDDGDPIPQEGVEAGKKPGAAAQAQKAAPAGPAPVNQEQAAGKDAKAEAAKQEAIAGYEQRFFKKTETGEQVFDPNAALSFIVPPGESKTRFSYVPPEAKPDAAKPAEQGADVPEWQKRLNERRDFTNGLRNNLFAWEKHYQEAKAQGVSDIEALQHAKSRISELVETEIEKYNWSLEESREKERAKMEQDRLLQMTSEHNARSNSLPFINELGGEDQYNEFMFGRMNNGKFVPGVAAEYINKLYEIANPDYASKTDAERGRSLREWWTRFTGDPKNGMNNLQFVYTAAMQSLLQKYYPKFMGQARDVQSQQTAQNRAGLQGARSGLSSKPKQATSGGWDRFFNGPPAETI